MEEKILELLSDENYKERKIDELARYFQKTQTQDYIQFIKFINELEDKGKLVRSKHNDYYLPYQLYS